MDQKLIPENLILQKQIESTSSDNVYDVLFFANCVACTCPAGGRKQLCKHIINTFEENFESIKEKAPNLSKKLNELIEIKNDKHIDPKEKKELIKELISKIIYLDATISGIATKNLQHIDSEPQYHIKTIAHDRLRAEIEILLSEPDYKKYMDALWNKELTLYHIASNNINEYKNTLMEYLTDEDTERLGQILKSLGLSIVPKEQKEKHKNEDFIEWKLS